MSLKALSMKKRLKGLYGITSQDMLLDNEVLFQQVEQALKGGMAILQYRNKHTLKYQNIDDLKRLKQLCHDYHALFIINDDVELCIEIGADGVHIGKDDDDLAHARKQLGQDAVLGVSCYNNLLLAQRAKENGASYIAFGAFYTSPTKPDAAIAKLELIHQARSLNTPICCIGGINLNNAPLLIKQGGDMVAVISELFNVGDIQTSAKQFTHCFALV